MNEVRYFSDEKYMCTNPALSESDSPFFLYRLWTPYDFHIFRGKNDTLPLDTLFYLVGRTQTGRRGIVNSAAVFQLLRGKKIKFDKLRQWSQCHYFYVFKFSSSNWPWFWRAANFLFVLVYILVTILVFIWHFIFIVHGNINLHKQTAPKNRGKIQSCT
jgi:uncharacterized membrane protein